MQNKNKIIITLFISVALVAVFIFLVSTSFGDNFSIPRGDTNIETITTFEGAENKIMITDDVKHSVPLDEIISGGLSKDGIPSIDNPKFVSVSEADTWLNDKEPGIAISIDGVDRFYPYQILVWHEIVNDMIKGKRILVTYCPLCLTGYVFDPVIQGERVEFGTSGRLWNSNLVMYDRKTDSLWSQILGEAIFGPETGARLTALPSDQVLYGNWKKRNLKGEVLSQDTGATRFYGSNPYGDYFSATDFALSLADFNDGRLKADAFIFGIVVGDKAKAYDIESIKNKQEVTDTFQNQTFVLRHDKQLDVVRVFKLQNGEEIRFNPFSSFWFSWVSVHPETELYLDSPYE